jgi:cytochrome b6-f complex iron-sulfur subunit
MLTWIAGAVVLASMASALAARWRRAQDDRHLVVGALRDRTLVPAAAASRRDPDDETVVAPAKDLATGWSSGDVGFTRRQFFNRSISATFVLAVSAFGTTTVAFLWPTLRGGFGAKIRAGHLDDLLASIRTTREPVYLPEGRLYVTAYPADALDEARDHYAGAVLDGMEAGVVALYQKCVHLGCRVPWCGSSQWFECPCHGSQYDRVGEQKQGPAPRGLDRFGVSVDRHGVVTVDTSTVFLGPPVGTNTTGQEAEGPHCVSR